jgi:hypothetical protein
MNEATENWAKRWNRQKVKRELRDAEKEQDPYVRAELIDGILWGDDKK